MDLELFACNTTCMATKVIWIGNLIYLTAYLPQIRLNYKLKTAQGFSGLMLLASVIGYIAQLFYIYCFDMPLAYKVLYPCIFTLFLILVLQRFYYDGLQKNLPLLMTCIISSLSVLFLIPYVMQHPQTVGTIAGWLAFCIWSIHQLPQIYKIFVAKSVKGFSLAFVSIMFLSVSLEFVAALILQFPIVVLFSIFRAILAYSFFYIQFLFFRHSN